MTMRESSYDHIGIRPPSGVYGDMKHQHATLAVYNIYPSVTFSSFDTMNIDTTVPSLCKFILAAVQ